MYNEHNIMGIDIGLRQLAVASIKALNGQELKRYFHSGKAAGYFRKNYRSLRRKLGQAKKIRAIKRIAIKSNDG